MSSRFDFSLVYVQKRLSKLMHMYAFKELRCNFNKGIIYIIFPYSLILLGESLDLEDLQLNNLKQKQDVK